jgi:AAA domain
MPERVILLLAGPSGSGKSFFVANLKNALIFDTDIGGGLSYADERIKRNGSVRVEVGSYLEVIDEIQKRRKQLASITTLAIDHLTTLQQEAVSRWNPQMLENTYGKEHDRAAKEWRKIREMARFGDFHLVCTAHLKNKYDKKELIGMVTDASKNLEADMQQVIYAQPPKGCPPSTSTPSLALVQKWRRDPEDSRGKVPASFPLTVEEFCKVHGAGLDGKREEIPMATVEQVAELENLLKVVKISEEVIGKWKAKAKADDWDGFSAEVLAKCIAHVKSMIPKNGH